MSREGGPKNAAKAEVSLGATSYLAHLPPATILRVDILDRAGTHLSSRFNSQRAVTMLPVWACGEADHTSLLLLDTCQ